MKRSRTERHPDSCEIVPAIGPTITQVRKLAENVSQSESASLAALPQLVAVATFTAAMSDRWREEDFPSRRKVEGISTLY